MQLQVISILYVCVKFSSTTFVMSQAMPVDPHILITVSNDCKIRYINPKSTHTSFQTGGAAKKLFVKQKLLGLEVKWHEVGANLSCRPH